MKQKSVLFCAAACVLCLILVAALCALAPWLLRLYVGMRSISMTVYAVLLAAFYACCVPAVLALTGLLRILANIRKKELFSRGNIRLVGLVSWCCVAVAVICFAAGFWYFPLFFLTAAMLFMFLIVRVVRSLMAAALDIEEENSLTI